MKILYDNTLSSKQLPKSQTFLFDSHLSPSKLNIKLKTHSLTCLDIPLETFVGFKEISTSFSNNHQRTMAGSVDLISEIQQQSNEETLTRFSSSKPLINIASIDKQIPKVQQQCREGLKNRFRISNSSITPTSFNDSVARLRRSGQLQNIHQSSLQTINKITEPKRSLFLTHNGSIPKFTFRNLAKTSAEQFQTPSKAQMSPFTSLPEIRSFVEQKRSNNKLKPPPLPALSSWKKSSSWSWKSNDALQLNPIQNDQINSNTNKEIQYQINDHCHSNLPIIIESPSQQRSSLQTLNQNHHLSFRQVNIQPKPNRLYQKKNSIPHSISNYEVSSERFSFQPTTRYPSTPLLAAYSHHKKNDTHSFPLHMSSIATFDDDDDSISNSSSFRSCLNSINELSENRNTDSSSSLSESCFQEISSNYDIYIGNLNETIKHTRLSSRHLCILQ